MTHIKQLDSLRAIAVILVIFSHWYTPAKGSTFSDWHGVIGPFAVDIFFVLSGFLITKILLKQRFNKNTLEIKTSSLIKNFYIRRALRIFPVYYLFLLLVSIYQLYTLGALKYEMNFYYTYTANYYQYFDNPENMTLGHLWSLAVEEQFYLIWPWLILLTPQTKILRTIIIFIAIGIISKYILHTIYNHFYMTVCCLDAFGAGALLAWLTTFKPEVLPKAKKISAYIAVIGITLIVFGLLFPHLNFIPLRIKNTGIAFYIILFLYQQRTENFKFDFIFNNPLMIYIGKISYGIYLFHISVPYIWEYIPTNVTAVLPYFLTHDAVWILNALFLILIASASYYYIERPFLKLKKYYS